MGSVHQDQYQPIMIIAAAVCLSQCRWFDATAWRGCVRLGVMPQACGFLLISVEDGDRLTKQACALDQMFLSLLLHSLNDRQASHKTARLLAASPDIIITVITV